MNDTAMYRFGGIALVVSGVSSALFWILAARVGTFAGADVVHRLSWVSLRAFRSQMWPVCISPMWRALATQVLDVRFRDSEGA